MYDKLSKFLYGPDYSKIDCFVYFSIAFTLVLITIYSLIFFFRKQIRDLTSKDIKCGFVMGNVLMIMSGIAFMVNLFCNFLYCYLPRRMDGSNNKYITNNNIFEYIDFSSFSKICTYEYLRGLFEITSYIPIAIFSYFLFKNKKIIKSVIYSVSLSVFSQLLCDGWRISIFYWQTLINNMLGVMLGIGFVYMISYLLGKSKISRLKLFFSQIPLLLVVTLYIGLYFFYYTNKIGNIYPDYYRVLDKQKLNVTYSGVEPMNEIDIWQDCGCALSLEQYELCQYTIYDEIGEENDMLVNYIRNDNNSKNKKWNILQDENEGVEIYYSLGEIVFYKKELESNEGNINDFDQFKDEFKKIGINTDNGVVESGFYDNEYKVIGCMEIEDGVYVINSASICLNSNGGIRFGKVSSLVNWKLKYIKDSTKKFGVVKADYIHQCEDKIVSVQEAYNKLYNGECYSPGLEKMYGADCINIDIQNVRLVLQVDNLNCYEYVYCFYIEPITTPDGTEIDRLFVPAMKSYY